MGNGAKAAEKRARNAAKVPAKKGASSQLKTNAAAQTYKCKTCFQAFQSTTTRKDLETHAEARHSKKFEDCFE